MLVRFVPYSYQYMLIMTNCALAITVLVKANVNDGIRESSVQQKLNNPHNAYTYVLFVAMY
jgi:hypothetical protein